MNSLNRSDDPPVTVDVIQQVKLGYEAEFERVLSDLIEAARNFSGYLGVNVFRPIDRHNLEYRIVFKFDRLSNLKHWEDSAIRHQLLENIKRSTVGESRFTRLTGLETWFALSPVVAIVPPPRYKMLVVSFLAIFPLINLLNWVLEPLLKSLPLFLRSSIVILVMLSLMTYVVMPWMTKLFSKWLYPNSKM
jgi:uncharacterized protein